ncbi:MAG: winged helix-turn-helix transcriptional regulator [Acutalibacteraceae bacterium]
MSKSTNGAGCRGVCPCASPCPIGEALRVIGGKWKMRILCTLYVDGTQRYNDLVRKTAGVTSAMLSASLKELEADGVIVRRQYEEIPPRVEYSLTKRGRALWPILHGLAHWATGEEYDGDE